MGYGKYRVYQVLSLLVLAVSIGVTLYISTPREFVSDVDHTIWEEGESVILNTKGEQAEFIYMQSRYILDDYMIVDDQITALDDNDNIIFIFTIHPLGRYTENASISYFPASDVQFNDYTQVFEIEYDDGAYHMSYECLNYCNEVGILVADSEPEVTVIDYSDYIIIPLLVAFLGLFFYTVTVFSKRRHEEHHDPYGHEYTSRPQKRQKREKY